MLHEGRFQAPTMESLLQAVAGLSHLPSSIGAGRQNFVLSTIGQATIVGRGNFARRAFLTGGCIFSLSPLTRLLDRRPAAELRFVCPRDPQVV